MLGLALAALKEAEERKRHVEMHLEESLSDLEGVRKSAEKMAGTMATEKHNQAAARPRSSIQDQLSAVQKSILTQPDLPEGTISPSPITDCESVRQTSQPLSTTMPDSNSEDWSEAEAPPKPLEEEMGQAANLQTEKPKIWEALDAAEQDVEGLTAT
eukprot:scaffold422996_cov55-Prasinocladus_malaysianus.AAC.1